MLPMILDLKYLEERGMRKGVQAGLANIKDGSPRIRLVGGSTVGEPSQQHSLVSSKIDNL